MTTVPLIENYTAALTIPGNVVSEGHYNLVKKITLQERDYFLKIYFNGGKGLRRFFGKSRARREYENVKLFLRLGISTAPVVNFHEERYQGLEKRAWLLTEAIPASMDLMQLLQNQDVHLRKRTWQETVFPQIIDYTQRLHHQRFVHHDLKWRNILVSGEHFVAVYFIDCPSGRRVYFSHVLEHGIVKDLACLYVHATRILSHTQCLR